MARGFIDHKGVLDEYSLTDGTQTKSIFQEPQSWGLLEVFKIQDGCIAAVRGDVLPGARIISARRGPRDLTGEGARE